MGSNAQFIFLGDLMTSSIEDGGEGRSHTSFGDDVTTTS